jgi:hypothetical protein
METTNIIFIADDESTLLNFIYIYLLNGSNKE